jgi:hypothetical protein
MKIIVRDEFSYYFIFFLLEISIKRNTHFSFTIFKMYALQLRMQYYIDVLFTKLHQSTLSNTYSSKLYTSPTLPYTASQKKQSFLLNETVSKLELVPPIS